MAKKETTLMRLAKMNGTLANDSYKKIIRSSPFISSSTSIKNFKEAYHSPKTPVEYRAILLASLFDSKIDFRKTFRHLTSNKYFLSSNIAMLCSVDVQGSKAFSLMTINKDKLQAVPLPLNQQMREEIQRWQPKADRNKLLTRALFTGSVHAQKSAYLLADIKTAIYAASDMLITNVKANDPLLIYLDSSDKPSRSKLLSDMTEEVGHFTTTQERFKSNLEHMKIEFEKIRPFFEKLGIDTRSFENEFNILKADVDEFVDNIYISREGEVDGLYKSFRNINNTIDETIMLAAKIDSIDLNDKSLYAIGRLEVIPTFVDYNPKKLGFHRRAAEEQVSGLIDEKIFLTKFDRNVR